MPTVATDVTETILDNHLKSVAAGDLDAVLSDYAPDAVLYTPEGAVRGLEELRRFFRRFLATLPGGFVENFEMLRRHVEGEVAYIAWRSAGTVALGTDTFIVRDGKIVVQTVAAQVTGSCGAPGRGAPP